MIELLVLLSIIIAVFLVIIAQGIQAQLDNSKKILLLLQDVNGITESPIGDDSEKEPELVKLGSEEDEEEESPREKLVNNNKNNVWEEDSLEPEEVEQLYG